MYAIYKPSSSSIRTTAMVRDITRLIVERSTANLQFHDTGATQIVNLGSAHGWVLAGAQAFSADVTPGQNDQKYILENTSRISNKVKRAAISVYHAFDNATIYTSTLDTVWGGICVGAVLEYGTARELHVNGRNDANTSSGAGAHGIYKAIHSRILSNYPTQIHIFVDSDRIILVGANYYGGLVMHGVTELPDILTFQKYRAGQGSVADSAPMATFVFAGNNFANGAQFPYMISKNTTDNTDGRGIQAVSFNRCVYLRRTNEYARLFNASFSNDLITAKYTHVYTENNTTGGAAGVFNTAVPTLSGFDGYLGGTLSLNHEYRLGQMTTIYNGFATNSNGDTLVPLYPVYYSFGWNYVNDIANFSTYGNIYHTNNLGALSGDTVTVGANQYVYFGSGTDYYDTQFNMLIKVT